MTTFFVDDSGLVTTASTIGDSIYVICCSPNSTLLCLSNDTIDLREGAATNGSSIGIKVEAAGDDITPFPAWALSARVTTRLRWRCHCNYWFDNRAHKTQDGADTIDGGTLVEGKLAKVLTKLSSTTEQSPKLALAKVTIKFLQASLLWNCCQRTGGEGRDTVMTPALNLVHSSRVTVSMVSTRMPT